MLFASFLIYQSGNYQSWKKLRCIKRKIVEQSLRMRVTGCPKFYQNLTYNPQKKAIRSYFIALGQFTFC